jgi:hypothetical protein
MRGGIANSIITSCVVIAIVISLTSAALIIYGLSYTSTENIYSFTHQGFWFTYDKQATTSKIDLDFFQFAGIAGLLAISIAGTILFKIQYKKSGSTELFFFVLSLTSMAFESFRIAGVLLYLSAVPTFVLTMITRIVYFGRFMSIFFLLCSSLYACEIRYHKFINFAGLMLVVALGISYLISLDGTRFLSTFLNQLDDEPGIFLIISTTTLFSIVNFIIAAIKRNMRFLYIAISILFVVAGQEIIFFSSNPILSGMAIASMVFGIIIFYKEIDRIYLLA